MSADQSVAAALRQTELFAGLEPDHLRALEELSKPVSLRAGTHLFSLGEEATRMYVVVSGQVRLTLPVAVHSLSREMTIDEKGPATAIAWSALVPPHKLTLSGFASTDVNLVGFERDDLFKLFEQSPVIDARVHRNLSRVVASRVAMLEALVIRDLQRWLSDLPGT